MKTKGHVNVGTVTAISAIVTIIGVGMGGLATYYDTLQSQNNQTSQINTEIQVVKSTQTNDENNVQTLQTNLVQVKSELDTVNENVFEMAKAYGLNPQK